MGEDFGVDLAFFEGVLGGGEPVLKSYSGSIFLFLLGVWPELLEEVIAVVSLAFFAVTLGDW